MSEKYEELDGELYDEFDDEDDDDEEDDISEEQGSPPVRDQMQDIYINVFDLLTVMESLTRGERNGSKLKAYKKVKAGMMGCIVWSGML